MKIEVGGIIFDDKTSLKQHIQSIVAETSLGEDVGENHLPFLIALLSRHARAKEKIGSGVKTFRAVKNGYGNKALHLIRLEGTSVEFSWTKCIVDQPHHAAVKEAFRAIVSEQIIIFKYKTLKENPHCALTGWPVDSSNCDVDHAHPDTFMELLKQFLGDVPVESVQVKNKKLVDRDMAVRWWGFHKTEAKLRLVGKEAHKRAAVKGELRGQ